MHETPHGTGHTPPPPPPPAPPESPRREVASDNRGIMIVLSYFGLLALIPLLVEKDDREVQWHAKHGLVLLVAEIVIFVGLQVVVMMLGAISGGLGCLFGLLTPVFALAVLILHVLCIVKGLNGERFLIPGLSDFANRF
ncbi:MAG: hypothetical protein MUE90_13015 [Thermoanaerobaculales bacterium]|nr:hypothetical protein [Thermoanaerobaculales bacterium]